MKLILAAGAALTLSACATQQNMEWAKIREGGMDLSQAIARCDYEATAATQGTDYSFRTSLGQELDRAIRKNDLERKCMAANGFALVPRRTAEQAASDAKYRELDRQLAQAKENRAKVRAELTAAPAAANAMDLSHQIAQWNLKVRDLETDLGYMKSEPISTDPASTETVGASR